MTQPKAVEDILDTKAQALEAEITSLEQTEREVSYRLESSTLTAERITDLEELAASLRKKLDYAENEFAKRRWLVETLDATATYRVVDTLQVLDAQCVIGARSLVIPATATRCCSAAAQFAAPPSQQFDRIPIRSSIAQNGVVITQLAPPGMARVD